QKPRVSHARNTSARMLRPSVEMLENRVTPTATLVAAYSFDEGTGTTAADASGNGNTATLANASWSSAGRFGGGMALNGTNSLASANDSASLELTTGMTLEAWVNPATVSSAWRDVVYKGNDNYYLSATSTNATNPVGGLIINGNHAEAIGSAGLPLNTWTYPAVTYDGTAVSLYVNGLMVSSTPSTGPMVTSNNPL